jgi:DNA-binding response OmpR family regulator
LTNLQGRRVLVIEDEYFIADDLKTALQAAGAEVLGPAATRQDAIALLQKSRPDIAVLDINLRGDTSFAIADELKSLRVPFLFATGYDANSIPARFADRTLFQKPFDPDRLAAAIAAESPR